MACKISDWLNNEFIREALQGGKDAPEDNSIIVESIEIEKPVAAGDNYVSDVYRALVKYREHDDNDTLLNTSFIIKVPKVGGIADIFLKLGILQKEVTIYNEYVPKLNKIFGVENKLTPKLYYSGRENVLVLEDLKFSGYVMADRRAQLDFEHATIALKTLATFHAASVRIHEDDPEFVENVVGKEPFYSEAMTEMNKEFAKISFTMIAQVAETDPKLERFVEQINNHGEKSWELILEAMKPKPNSLNVLNHGDYWVNNMLFKYDENNKPIELKIIDLQVSRYARPAIDLLYFFYGSVKEEVRIKRIDELLEIYREELNVNLERFGVSKRLSLPELKVMMDECSFFAFLITISLYAVVIGDPKDGIFDMTEITEDQMLNLQNNIENNPMLGYFKNERFREILGDRLAEFEKSGWFL